MSKQQCIDLTGNLVTTSPSCEAIAVGWKKYLEPKFKEKKYDKEKNKIDQNNWTYVCIEYKKMKQ